MMELVSREHLDRETWNAMRIRLIDAIDEQPEGWKKDGFRNALSFLTAAFEHGDHAYINPVHTVDCTFMTQSGNALSGALTWFAEDNLLGLIAVTEDTCHYLHNSRGVILDYKHDGVVGNPVLVTSFEETFIEFLSGGSDYIRIATDFLHVPTGTHVMTFMTSSWDIREADIGLKTPFHHRLSHFEKLRLLEQDRKKSVAVLHRCIEENVRLVKHMGQPAIIETINLTGLTKDDMAFKIRGCDEVFQCRFLEWLE